MGRLDGDRKETIKKNVNDAQDYLGPIYDEVKADLIFDSGGQYSDSVTTAREGRPCEVLNLVKKYRKRIVNPTKQNPYKAEIEFKDEKLAGQTDLQPKLQGILDSTVNSQEGREATLQALSTAVASGYGYVIAGVDFTDDNSMDQKVTLTKVKDPTSIGVSRHDSIDGSDLRFGFHHDVIDKEVAKELYGEDSVIQKDDWVDSVFSKWDYEQDTVPEMVYYWKEPYKVTRVFDSSGEFKDLEKGMKLPDELPEGVQTRKITKYKVNFVHIVGNNEVDSGELPFDTIPIFPVYGEVKYTEERIKYSGIVDVVRDVQTSINYIKSSESEIISTAPISQWVMATGQAKSRPDDWGESNVKAKVLMYDVVNDPKTGAVMAQPPMRVDNTVQTQSLVATRVQNMRDMGEALGMPDVAFGMVEGTQQSGKSVVSRQEMAEITNFDYQINLEKTLDRLSEFCLKLGMELQTKSFELEFKGQKKMVTWEMLDVDLDDFELKIAQGPRAISANDERVSKTIEVAQLNPAGIPMIWDQLLAEAGNEKMAKRYRKTLPPEILEKENGGSGIDPEAQQALNTATQTIEEQQGLMDSQNAVIEEQGAIIQQMQAKLLDDSKDRETDLDKELIKGDIKLKEAELRSKTQIEVESMKQSGSNKREVFKAEEGERTELRQNVKEAKENAQANIVPFDANMGPMVEGPVVPEKPIE